MLLKTSAFNGSQPERRLIFTEKNLAAHVMLKNFNVPREFFNSLETISTPQTQQNIGALLEASFTLEEAAGEKNSQALQKAIALLKTIKMVESPDTTAANYDRQPIRPETEYQFNLRLEPNDGAYYFSIPEVKYEIKLPQLLGEGLSVRIRMKNIELGNPVYVTFHQNDNVFSLAAKPKLKIFPGQDTPVISIDVTRKDFAWIENLLPPRSFSGNPEINRSSFARP